MNASLRTERPCAYYCGCGLETEWQRQHGNKQKHGSPPVAAGVSASAFADSVADIAAAVDSKTVADPDGLT